MWDCHEILFPCIGIGTCLLLPSCKKCRQVDVFLNIDYDIDCYRSFNCIKDMPNDITSVVCIQNVRFSFQPVRCLGDRRNVLAKH